MEHCMVTHDAKPALNKNLGTLGHLIKYASFLCHALLFYQISTINGKVGDQLDQLFTLASLLGDSWNFQPPTSTCAL